MRGEPAGCHVGFPCRVLVPLSGEPDMGLAYGINKVSPICQVCRVPVGVDTAAETRVDEFELSAGMDPACRVTAEDSYSADPLGLE